MRYLGIEVFCFGGKVVVGLFQTKLNHRYGSHTKKETEELRTPHVLKPVTNLAKRTSGELIIFESGFIFGNRHHYYK